MKHRIVRQIVIVKLAVLALTVSCLVQSPVHSQGITGHIVIFPSVGLAPRQSLRLTIFNPDGSPLRAQARVRHTGGANFVFGDGSVRGGTFHSFDLKRSDIPLPGEDGTGRLQLSASISYDRPGPPGGIDRVVAFMEIVEAADGSSNTILLGERRLPSSPGNDGGHDVLIGGSTLDVFMGIAPGQTLRVTLFYPQTSVRDYPPSRLILSESNGSFIAQSPDLVIPPGAFRSVDFRRSDLPLAGEDGTGRVQLRVHLEPATDEQSLIAIFTRTGLIASFELIENSTGRTKATYVNNLKQIGLGSF